jgi:hypothetical protein
MLPPMKSEKINSRLIAFVFPYRGSRERVVTETRPSYRGGSAHPDFIGPRQYGENLSHFERYGWEPSEDRKEYGFGGRDGTPRFKGYFG